MSHLGSGQITIYNIARTLGHCTVFLGKLCTSIKINPFSKFKPFRFAAKNFPATINGTTYNNEQAALSSAGVAWGMTGPIYTDPEDMCAQIPANGAFNYTYTRPNQHHRINDFFGYFHHAQPCFMQANGTSFIIDMVQDLNPGTFLFYMYFNYKNGQVNGRLSNKAFSTTMGINDSVAAVDSGDQDYNLSVEELTFLDSGGSNPLKLVNASNNARLGLMIFDTSGSTPDYVTEVFSNVAVTEQSQLDVTMYRISTQSVTTTTGINLGDYTGVACARITDLNTPSGTSYYLPVFSKPSFPAKFPVNIGGLSQYPIRYLGVCTTPDGYFESSLTTNLDDIYFKIEMHNNSKSVLTVYTAYVTSTASKAAKITLRTNITPYILVHGSSTPYTTPWTKTSLPDQAVHTTTTDIPIGSSAQIIYKVTNIWSTNGGSPSGQQLDSGTYVDIVPKLDFAGVDTANNYYPTMGATPLYRITYG